LAVESTRSVIFESFEAFTNPQKSPGASKLRSVI